MLQSTAQGLIVLDPAQMGHPMGGGDMSLVPVELGDIGAEPLEVHDGDGHEEHGHVEPEGVGEVEIVLGLPGAPPNTPDPEPLEVHEEIIDDKGDKSKVDENEAKNEKWNWSKRGPKGFIAWVKERCDDVPKHSGYDTAGLERAVAYLERLDNEVSKAMRMDLDGELDANQIEKVRAIIDNGIERLQDRLDKVKDSKKKPKKPKKSTSGFDTDGLIIKEAQKITGVQGIYIMAPLLASRIARVCINGMVSGGHDIEDLFDRQVKFYKLDVREQAEVMQLLADMGYAVRQDRGFMPDQDIDVSDSDNMDWAANFNSSSEIWGKDR